MFWEVFTFLIKITNDVRVGRPDDFLLILNTVLPQQVFPITDSFRPVCMNCTVTLAAAESWH